MLVDKPFPYQYVGADFLSRRRYAGLFDDMGVGKTVQAIMAADRIGARKIVVVAPKLALINWTREIARWSPGSTAAILTNGEPNPQARWLVINYDLFQFKPRAISEAPAAFQRLMGETFDLLVIDESQALKSAQAARTKNIYGNEGFARRCQRVWALSGTPCPNNVGELFTTLRALYPAPLMIVDRFSNRRVMTEAEFYDRYTANEYTDWGGWRVLSVRDMPFLRRQLEQFALRRTIADVLPELPPLRFSTLTLDHVDIAEEQTEEMQRLRRRVQGAMLIDGDDEALRQLRLAELSSPHISTVRRATGELKAAAVAEFLQDEICFSGLDKVVVFYHHKSVGQIMLGRLRHLGAALIDGTVPFAQRQPIIDAFQNDRRLRILCLQLDVGSKAITLTAAAHVVFAEFSWTPSTNVQAARRCARLGQTRSVLARLLTLAGSIDELILAIVRRKAAMLALLFPTFDGEITDAADAD